jgi:hypothetical protein
MAISKINSNSLNGDESTLSFSTSGVERMVITSAGNVGIGTTPDTDAKLHISSNDTIIRMEDADDNGSYADIRYLNGRLVIQSDDNSASGYSPTIEFQVNNSEAMRIDSNGNMGIGVSPLSYAKLHISSTGTTAFYVDGNQTSDGAICDFVVRNGTDSVSFIKTERTGANDAGALAFGTQATGGSLTERMRIDSSGRVTTPYQPHIHGSLTNTGGSGYANYFYTAFSRGGLSFVTDRITVPIAGLYQISFNTICDPSSVRRDTNIAVNGVNVTNGLSEDTTTGYHYRSHSVVVNLAASDYIQFNNDDWYSSTSTGYQAWRTASVTFLG